MKINIIYPEDDDCELGNNAERLPNYPDYLDDELDDEYYDDKDKFLDEFMKGEH